MKRNIEISDVQNKIEINQQDLDEFNSDLVFCYNDIKPRSDEQFSVEDFGFDFLKINYNCN